MQHMTRTKFEKKLESLRRKNEIIKQKNELKAEKRKYKKLPSTSKLLLLVVIFMCIEIIAFSQYAMIEFKDINALYTLIGVPVSIVPVALGYYYKSKSENTEGGIVYETTMKQMELDNNAGVAKAGGEYNITSEQTSDNFTEVQ